MKRTLNLLVALTVSASVGACTVGEGSTVFDGDFGDPDKIGRASCRERVWLKV
jgi:hypothetical protein